MKDKTKKPSIANIIALIVKLLLGLTSVTFIVLSLTDVVDFNTACYFIFIPSIILNFFNAFESYRIKNKSK